MIRLLVAFKKTSLQILSQAANPGSNGLDNVNGLFAVEHCQTRLSQGFPRVHQARQVHSFQLTGFGFTGNVQRLFIQGNCRLLLGLGRTHGAQVAGRHSLSSTIFCLPADRDSLFKIAGCSVKLLKLLVRAPQ